MCPGRERSDRAVEEARSLGALSAKWTGVGALGPGEARLPGEARTHSANLPGEARTHSVNLPGEGRLLGGRRRERPRLGRARALHDDALNAWAPNAGIGGAGMPIAGSGLRGRVRARERR